MKKYYIGLAILMAIALGLTVFVLANGKDSKLDDETAAKAETIGNKITDYMYAHNSVPDSLATVGVTDAPSTITYQKIDAETFKFCANFKSSGSSFDAGPTGLLTGLLYKGAVTPTTNNANSPYLDVYSLRYQHKKGNNCQTIKPSLVGSSSNASFQNFSASASTTQKVTVKCPSDTSSSFTVRGEATIDSVDTTGLVLKLKADGQKVTNADGSSGTAVSELGYEDSVTHFFDANCKAATSASLKAGAKITFYMFSTGENFADQVEL